MLEQSLPLLKQKDAKMEYKIITISKKYIVGLSVRTGNHAPDVMQKIGGVWLEFFSGAVNKIANKKGEAVYGVYTNYESDVNGKYDMIASCEVSGELVSSSFCHNDISKSFAYNTISVGIT